MKTWVICLILFAFMTCVRARPSMYQPSTYEQCMLDCLNAYGRQETVERLCQNERPSFHDCVKGYRNNHSLCIGQCDDSEEMHH